MILQEINYTQLTAGVGTHILEADTTQAFLEWVEPTWITSIKIALANMQGGVQIKNTFSQKTQLKHEIFSVEAITGTHQDKITLQLLNRCKIYVQTLILADITVLDGTHLDTEMLHSSKNPSYQSVYKWK